MSKIKLTKDELVGVFELWEKDSRLNPSDYNTRKETLKEDLTDTATACANKFIECLSEIKGE